MKDFSVVRNHTDRSDQYDFLPLRSLSFFFYHLISMAIYLKEEKHHFPYTRFALKQSPFLQIGSWLEKQVSAFIKKNSIIRNTNIKA